VRQRYCRYENVVAEVAKSSATRIVALSFVSCLRGCIALWQCSETNCASCGASFKVARNVVYWCRCIFYVWPLQQTVSKVDVRVRLRTGEKLVVGRENVRHVDHPDDGMSGKQ
jgi:hypothetical protein